MELLDIDHVVRAKTDLGLNSIGDSLGKFVRQIKEELVAGETAFLEIEGSDIGPVTLEICHCE
jgi:hypothetical protein